MNSSRFVRIVAANPIVSRSFFPRLAGTPSRDFNFDLACSGTRSLRSSGRSLRRSLVILRPVVFPFRIRPADQVARPRAKPSCSRCISSGRGRDTVGPVATRRVLIAAADSGKPGARNSSDLAPLFPSRRERGMRRASNGTRYSRRRERDPVRSAVPVRAMEPSSCAGNGLEIVVVGNDCHGTKTKTEDTRVAAPTRVHPPRAAHERSRARGSARTRAAAHAHPHAV